MISRKKLVWFGIFAALLLMLTAGYVHKTSQWTDDASRLNGASKTSSSIAVKGDPHAAPQVLWFTWKRVIMKVDTTKSIYVGWQPSGGKAQYHRKAIKPDDSGYFAMRIGKGDVNFVVLGTNGQPAPALSLVAITGDSDKYKNVPLL